MGEGQQAGGAMRRANRTDSTHKAIVDALRKMGCSVEPIQSGKAGVPDLVVGFRGKTELVEVKAPKGKLNPAQDAWHAQWRGSTVKVCRSVDEAMDALMGEDDGDA